MGALRRPESTAGSRAASGPYPTASSSSTGEGAGKGGMEITPAPLPGSKAVANLLCPPFIKIIFFTVNKPREQIQNAFFPHCHLNIYEGFVLLCM